MEPLSPNQNTSETFSSHVAITEHTYLRTVIYYLLTHERQKEQVTITVLHTRRLQMRKVNDFSSLTANQQSVFQNMIDPNTVDTYDSGDDWEIGVGNLIIDLDADLEKDRQKFEMNNSTNTTSSSNSKDCGGLASSGAGATAALADGLKFASVQPSAPQGNSHKETSKSKVKRSKTSKDANKSLPSAALYGIPEISGTGKRQEVQGRPGEATGMNSALGQSVSSGGGGGGSNPNSNSTSTGTSAATAGTASCGKSKEEKPGKSQSSRGAKRDKDAGKSRKDKHDLLQGHQNGSGSQAPSGGLYGFGAKSNGGGASPFHCGGTGSGSVAAAGEVSKSAPDSGLMGNSMLVKKEEEEEESHRRIKKLKTEKVG